MSSLHISLTPRLEEFTRERVNSGLYNNASEVVREALRLMIEHKQNQETLQSSVARGFEQVEAGEFKEIESEDEFLKLARSRRV